MELLVDFILVGGILITLLIFTLLTKKARKELPHALLAVFFLQLLFVSLRFYSEYHQVLWLYHVSFIPEDTIVWFIGPLLMLYIKSLFISPKGIIRNNFRHFIPYLLYTSFISIPVLISIIKDEFVFQYLEHLYQHSYAIVLVRSSVLIAYIFYCLHLFRKYLGLIKTNYSSLGNHDFLWIKKLLTGCLLVIVLDALSELYELVFGTLSWDAGYITVVAMIGLIVYLGYHGINQSKILLPDFLLGVEKVRPGPENETKPVSNITFSENEFEAFRDKLSLVLKNEKPYLDEDLTLNKLAQLMSTTDKKLSTFLNQYLDTTFYDLINKERVASVKEKLLSGDFENYTLLGVAFESGFKSKTSFNRIFKKETGLSPSEYRKTHKPK